MKPQLLVLGQLYQIIHLRNTMDAFLQPRDDVMRLENYWCHSEEMRLSFSQELLGPASMQQVFLKDNFFSFLVLLNLYINQFTIIKSIYT